jgi:hypothetical protein
MPGTVWMPDSEATGFEFGISSAPTDFVTAQKLDFVIATKLLMSMTLAAKRQTFARPRRAPSPYPPTFL